jgi:hypothetical protein
VAVIILFYYGKSTKRREAKTKIGQCRTSQDKKSRTDSDQTSEEYLDLVRFFKEACRTFPFIFSH